mmetsp:Transcript_2184/g.7105  ORF Transcript_2184/g.7105 Transcript_2184/m.7105 type:complete len:132 (-) Transcript_2184:1257-1652(-)
MEVVGSHHPPTATNAALAKAVGFAQFSAIAATFSGAQVFPALGMAVPSFVAGMAENKLQSAGAAFFLGNTLSQNLLNTGAFEVYYDGDVVFSKLNEKRLPNVQEILRGLESRVGRARKRAAETARLEEATA